MKGVNTRNSIDQGLSGTVDGEDVRGSRDEVVLAPSSSRSLMGDLRLLDEIPAFVWRASLGGVYRHFNLSWKRLTGVQEPNDTWFELIHLEDRQRVEQEHARAFRERMPFELIYRLRSVDGSFRWLNEVGTVLYGSLGQPIGIQGHASDLTEWKQAEELLHASELRAQAVAEMSPVGIFRTDAEGNCRYTNQRWFELTQMSGDEAKAKGWTRAVHEDDCDDFVREWERFAVTGTAFNLQFRVARPDGTFIWVLGQAKAERDSDGEVVGCVGTITDLTERHGLEQEQLKLSKLESLGVLAGGIAHDFNNQLTPIILNLGFALDTELNEEVREWLDEAKRAADDASQLTRQLLTFAKGGHPIVKTIKLPGLLRQSMNFALRGTPVEGELAIDDGLWPVDVDSGQLSQVVQNLVINARQAMPTGGKVTITAENVHVIRHPSLPRTEGRFVHVSVADDGEGISKENIKKIFDPYFTTKADGHGLGLASTLSIIRKHAGEMAVVSEIGEGTNFSLYLPAGDPDAVVEVPPSKLKDEVKEEESPTIKRRKRVLIMDDELLIRRSTGILLGKLGYLVEMAENGEEALEIYKRHLNTPDAIDLCLMDLTIPGGMGGKEAIEHLKRLDPNARAIVFSGYSNDRVMAKHQQYGFCDAVQKPFQPQQLAEVIEKHTD